MKGRRRSNAKRYATGRIVQPAAAEMRATVIDARQRVYGLGKAQAAEPEAIDILGRMYLAGEISQRQKQAGDRADDVADGGADAADDPADVDLFVVAARHGGSPDRSGRACTGRVCVACIAGVAFAFVTN